MGAHRKGDITLHSARSVDRPFLYSDEYRRHRAYRRPNELNLPIACDGCVVAPDKLIVRARL